MVICVICGPLRLVILPVNASLTPCGSVEPYLSDMSLDHLVAGLPQYCSPSAIPIIAVFTFTCVARSCLCILAISFCSANAQLVAFSMQNVKWYKLCFLNAIACCIVLAVMICNCAA